MGFYKWRWLAEKTTYKLEEGYSVCYDDFVIHKDK